MNTRNLFRVIAISTVAAILVLANPAHADSDGERAALARLAHELAVLEPLLREAQAQADPDTRIHFRYDWLQADLTRVRSGIQEHIDSPRAEPRTVTPLRGDYRR